MRGYTAKAGQRSRRASWKSRRQARRSRNGWIIGMDLASPRGDTVVILRVVNGVLWGNPIRRVEY